jgi:hypothetical protein
MDNLRNIPASEPSINDLRAECESLRNLVGSLVVLLLVVSGTLNLYLWRQYRIANGAVAEIRQMVANYNQNSVPQINDFLQKLVEFNKKSPDFGPILAKYGVQPGNTNGVPLIGVSAVPAPTPPPGLKQ